jgi:hypothetical protein
MFYSTRGFRRPFPDNRATSLTNASVSNGVGRTPRRVRM